MSANRTIKILMLLLFSGSILFTKAQQTKKCGPYIVDKAALKKALDYEKANNQNPQSPASPIVIRVFFRICEPDGGSISDIGETQIASDFKHLVGAYSADNICFINAGYNYIRKSTLDTFNVSNDNYQIFFPYGLQNCITVFYIDHLGGKNGSSGGGFSGITYTQNNSSAWTIVEKDYIGQGVTEHEVGHCFGLLHTFDFANGNGLEDIDGSNGSTSADLIADTHADPYAFANEDKNQGSCFSASCTSTFCSYTGTCSDPKGRTDYTPPYYDLMSYWATSRYPTYTITSGQYTRINSFLNTSSALLVTESAQTVTDAAFTISSGYHINSAVTTLTTSGTILINGTALATLGAGQTVFLEPGFDAAPGTGGRVFIRHAFCDTTSNGYSFATAQTHNLQNQNLATNDDKTNEGNLVAYPNPASSIIHLSFSFIRDENNAVIEVYDLNSKKLKEVSLGNRPAGKYSEILNLDKIGDGMYMIVVRSSSLLMRTKVAVAK